MLSDFQILSGICLTLPSGPSLPCLFSQVQICAFNVAKKMRNSDHFFQRATCECEAGFYGNPYERCFPEDAIDAKARFRLSLTFDQFN